MRIRFRTPKLLTVAVVSVLFATWSISLTAFLLYQYVHVPAVNVYKAQLVESLDLHVGSLDAINGLQYQVYLLKLEKESLERANEQMGQARQDNPIHLEDEALPAPLNMRGWQ